VSRGSGAYRDGRERKGSPRFQLWVTYLKNTEQPFRIRLSRITNPPEAGKVENAPASVPSLIRSPRRPSEDGRLAMTGRNVNLNSQKWFFKSTTEKILK